MTGLAQVPRAAEAARLRTVLDAIGYTEEALLVGLRLPRLWAYLPAWRPMLLAQLAEGPQGVLQACARALYLDEPFDPAELGPELFGALQAAALIEPHDVTRWRSPFVVAPYRNRLLVSDPPGPRGMLLNGPRLPMRSRVFCVDASTDLLLRALVPNEGPERVLDLGCGTGVVSLVLSAQTASVVGTDLNERAVAIAGFNAALNDVSNVEWRYGDLLEPVAGMQFDRVVSNLPFVPTPGQHALYWDGGRRGQDLVHRLVTGLRNVLAEGGFAQFTAGVVNPGTEDFLGLLGDWTAGRDYSILVLYGTPQSMEQSIPLLATSEADPHEPEYESVVMRWRQAAREANVQEVAPAVVTIRNDGCGMRAALPIHPAPNDFGASVLALFESWRQLKRLPRDWEAWRSVRLLPCRDVRLEQDSRWDGQDWKAGRWRVSFADRPWRLKQSLGRDSVAILRLCDGLRSLEDVVFSFCMQSGKNPSAVRSALLDAVPSWVSGGILAFKNED